VPMSSKYNAEYRQVDCPFGKCQYDIVRKPAQLNPMIICITGAGAVVIKRTALLVFPPLRRLYEERDRGA